MQFPKQQTRENMLASARVEFMDQGFEKASIRKIAAAAETSKSNVYNYFQDKDALFTAVVEGTTAGIEAGFARLREENLGKTASSYRLEAQREVIEKIMAFVFTHQDDLKLLFFRSSGSSRAGFKDGVIGGLTAVLADWVSHAAPEKQISDAFVGLIAGFYVNAIEQLLAKDISPKKAAVYVRELLPFIYGGWSAVL